MAKKPSSFRVGKVRAFLRSRNWYLCYHDQGRRRRPRVGPEREAARQLAAQINGQLEIGAPAALSFEPISLPTLRDRWLQHHEQVLRSAVKTIDRYRTATNHLLRFLDSNPVRHAAVFHNRHAEEFVSYLRRLNVSPNGHANTVKRLLMDKGLQFVLECCRAMFNYAAKRRHLAPYAENPFRILEIDRIPVEQMRPIVLMTPEQERAFLESCDDWQFPLFLTLMLTGLRPGELCHLLLPDNLDLDAGVLRVRNKPRLGWQVKTRNERDIPLVPVLAAVLRAHLGDRRCGPIFRRRTATSNCDISVGSGSQEDLEKELAGRIDERVIEFGRQLERPERLKMARAFWRKLGAIEEDRVRVEFMRLTKAIGMRGCTAPKLFRHQFATALQQGRVDPLIRNELMGHVAAGSHTSGYGLAMTAVYTHTRPETRREQLELALANHAAVNVAASWLERRSSDCDRDLSDLSQ
jgi:integrase